MVEDCIFCKIVAKEAPASVLFQDDRVLAFMDILPINPGHLLVIPKEHLPELEDLDEELAGYLFKIALRLEKALRRSGLPVEGVNLFLADGEVAFQEVFHTHLHVIPRLKGDSFKITAAWSVSPTREELDRVAGQIRDAVKLLPG